MKVRALVLALALATVAVVVPAGCSRDEPAASGRTTTTLPLEDLDVDALDPLAAVDVTAVGPVPGAVPVDAESVDDIGGGQLSVTAFVRTCAQVTEVVFEDQLARVMVDAPGCDGPPQLVRLVVPAPAGFKGTGP